VFAFSTKRPHSSSRTFIEFMGRVISEKTDLVQSRGLVCRDEASFGHPVNLAFQVLLLLNDARFRVENASGCHNH